VGKTYTSPLPKAQILEYLRQCFLLDCWIERVRKKALVTGHKGGKEIATTGKLKSPNTSGNDVFSNDGSREFAKKSHRSGP
jgi:hypothetical protein